MPAAHLKPRHILELLVLSLIWGAAYLFTRAAVPEFGPVPLIALRMSIACLVLLPILAYRGGLGSLRQFAGQFALQGTVFTSLSFLLIAWSALSISAGLTAVLSATAPMFGAVIAWLVFKEKIAGWKLFGLFLGLLGVSILVWGKVSFKTGASSVKLSLAVGAGLLSSVIWGAAANYTRAKSQNIDPVATTTGTMLAASVFLIPLAALDAYGPQWIAGQAMTVNIATPTTKAWIEALFLGVICSGLGMLMYFRLLKEIGTVPTMSVTFMSPVVAILLGAWYLNEAITLQVIIGCAVVLVGTALSVGLIAPKRA